MSDAADMHIPVEPSILYFGTPVILLSTLNDDGSANLAPMSSVWWLGWNCMLGLGAKGHTAQNLLREKEAVLNLPSAAMAGKVNALAKLTGSDPVPPHKRAMGAAHPFGKRPDKPTTALAFEMRVVRAFAEPDILVPDAENRIDPNKWRPLFMSFCRFYGLGESIHYSTLAETPEEAYRRAPRMKH